MRLHAAGPSQNREQILMQYAWYGGAEQVYFILQGQQGIGSAPNETTFFRPYFQFHDFQIFIF